MNKDERTSAKVAIKAAKALNRSDSSPLTKSLAGSALAQSRREKETSKDIATSAAKALENPRASKIQKTLAGSVLTQKTRK